MNTLHNTYGIAARNFTSYPEMPDMKALVDYGVKMEEMGFDSIWVWDHILLGVEPCFPVVDSLTLLTAFAAGWYKREFDAVGVPFEQRGKIMDENLDVLKRFWTEHMVKGDWPHHKIPAGVMYPKPAQKPRPPILIGGYVDVVLKRAAVAGDGWLTYFYRPESFAKSWEKVRNFAKEAGKDPDTLLNGAQLPIMVGKSRAAVESQMMEWLGQGWEQPARGDSPQGSAIMGTVDECVAQLKEHLAVGVQKLVFVPYKYQMDQIEIIAKDIIPRLRGF